MIFQENLIKNNINTIEDLLTKLYSSKKDKNKKIFFKNKETKEIYNLAYHYIESEIMYLYVYKDSSEKTVEDLNSYIIAESNNECWNHAASMYLEDLAKTEYSESDYRFSDERIENGDLYEERLNVVKSLDVYIVFDEKENLNNIDSLLDNDTKIKTIKEVISNKYDYEILF